MKHRDKQAQQIAQLEADLLAQEDAHKVRKGRGARRTQVHSKKTAHYKRKGRGANNWRKDYDQ